MSDSAVETQREALLEMIVPNSERKSPSKRYTTIKTATKATSEATMKIRDIYTDRDMQDTAWFHELVVSCMLSLDVRDSESF